MQLHVLVDGPVPYRRPDGARLTVPRGPCVADVRGGNVQVFWASWRGRVSAVLPLAEFEKHRRSGHIVTD